MVWTVPSALARTSGAYIKFVCMSAISAVRKFVQLEGLRLRQSSKICSPGTQHARERSSEGSFHTCLRVQVRMQPQLGLGASGFERSVTRLRLMMK